MHSLINKGMHAGYHSTVSEYLRFLVRRDQMPVASRQKEEEFTMPKTANQVIEDALLETGY